MSTTIQEEELEYTPSGALDHVLQNVLMVDPKKSDLARILRGSLYCQWMVLLNCKKKMLIVYPTLAVKF